MLTNVLNRAPFLKRTHPPATPSSERDGSPPERVRFGGDTFSKQPRTHTFNAPFSAMETLSTMQSLYRVTHHEILNKAMLMLYMLYAPRLENPKVQTALFLTKPAETPDGEGVNIALSTRRDEVTRHIDTLAERMPIPFVIGDNFVKLFDVVKKGHGTDGDDVLADGIQLYKNTFTALRLDPKLKASVLAIGENGTYRLDFDRLA